MVQAANNKPSKTNKTRPGANPAGQKAPPRSPPSGDTTYAAGQNRVFDLMMKTINDYGQNEVRGYNAWAAVGNLENMVEWTRELGDLPPARINEMVSKLLDLATQFPDQEDGYILSVALLSATGQAVEANADFASSLSLETRQRLTDLARQLDSAVPQRLRDLLVKADNMENFQRNGRSVSEWNNQVNPGDVDFNQGVFATASNATDGLKAFMGEHFAEVQSAREAPEPSQPQPTRLDAILAEAKKDPLFALVLAIIAAAEDTQQNAAEVLTDEGFQLSEQGLAGVQYEVQKAAKLLEMAQGIFDSLKDMQDTIGRGW